ncbi:MAG: hypothetical protein U5J62_07390 [Desulfurivibrio sp.]|nr:hypothetical protein [Desulfurivibrio sp.]
MEAAQKKRVLVIEDEARIAEGLRLNLSLAGYAVSVAADGIDGLETMAHLASASHHPGYHAADD